MPKSENKTENCTIVNGVVLTEKAIDRLKTLQGSNNDDIDFASKAIQKGIRVIIRNISDCAPEELRDIQSILIGMACVCDWIEDLEKP